MMSPWPMVLFAACLSLGACNQPQRAANDAPPVSAPATEFDTSGDFPKGFSYAEAAAMLELCINIGDPGEVADTTGWTPVWPALNAQLVTFGSWQNSWRLWQKTDAPNTYAIVIRGTVASEPSILEDVVATSISAQPVIKAWPDGYLSFTLARNVGAETHLGFTYALAFLMFANDHGILQEIKSIAKKGAKIYITGHSQGAAVATLVHAFLHYAINDPSDQYGIGKMAYSLKSYFFAQPKPGNWQFALDFARIAASRGTSFVIDNARDWVPQVPLTLEFLDEPQNDLADQLNSRGLSFVVTDLPRVAQFVRSLPAFQVEDRFARDLQSWNTPRSRMDTRYRINGTPLAATAAISINYESVGSPVPVFGPDPHAPGVPADDWLYQHHASTYRQLLQTQLKPPVMPP